MCGIVGIVSFEGPIDPGALRAAQKALRHRGPDGSGLWLSPTQSVGLAHTRLSVIDLAGGQQPISNEDGSLQIVVNGEFYDFLRIRRELEEKGHCFRSGSDSEIALHLYEEEGAAALTRLRGEFALLLWDARQQMLFAARDRFGIKPLCYARVGQTFYFASEAKALFAAGVPAEWDEASFYQCASLQYTLPDRTLFAGVKQLPPGHYLIACDGQARTHRYWDFGYAREGEGRPEVEERDWIARLYEGLDEAVRLRMQADVPVCCYLSGGIDSSTVLALVARHSAHPVDCFTLCFSEAPYDESEIAREMAARVGARFHPVRVSALDLLTNLSDAVFYSEGLTINGHLAAKFLLSRAVREAGYKVVLVGEGADEILAGYAHLRQDFYQGLPEEERERALAQLRASNAAGAGIFLAEGESLPLDAVRRILGFVPGFLAAKASFGRKMRALLAPDFLLRFSGRDAFRMLLDAVDVPGQLSGRHPVHQSLYLWSKQALANYILRMIGDGTEMAHSVEGRLPFLDHPLVELVRAMPLSLKIRDGVEKYVLREAMRPLLTDTLYRRQKQPLLAPPLGSDPASRDFVQDTLRSRAMAAVPFFDKAALRALLERWPTLTGGERTATDPVLMTALSACFLQERLLRPS